MKNIQVKVFWVKMETDGSPKCWHLTATLHGVPNQKNSIRISTEVKTPNFDKEKSSTNINEINN